MRIPYLIALLGSLLAGCGGDASTSSTKPSGTSATVSAASPASSGGKALLSAYLGMRDALVEGDTLALDAGAASLRRIADSLSRDSLFARQETALPLGNILAESDGLLGDNGLDAKRRAFGMVGEAVRDFLIKSGYDAGKVYVQTCPMAFNDSEAASWLSDSREILNPYMGRRHSKYGAGMLHCGELTDSLGTDR